MDFTIDLGPHELALLAAICGPDLKKQGEHAARLLRKILNRQPDKDLLREFEDFYSAYPRKEAPGRARSAYVKARGIADASTILRGLTAYCVAVRGKETRFIQLPATWLNGECWASQYESKVSPQSPGLSTRADPNYGYRSQVQHFIRTGRWCFKGTAPTDPTCLIPRGVLREFASVFAAKGLDIPALNP